MGRKITKVCLVCGKEFEGSEGAFTCSSACRTHMSRLLAKGKKPEFWLVAKSKGQKVPLFFAPHNPKKEEKQTSENNIHYQNTDEKSFDGKRVNTAIMDEIGQTAAIKPLSPEETAEIEKNIRNIRLEKCPLNAHPKTFALNQEIRISELEEKLNR